MFATLTIKLIARKQCFDVVFNILFGLFYILK
jgi:hypothetical protein